MHIRLADDNFGIGKDCKIVLFVYIFAINFADKVGKRTDCNHIGLGWGLRYVSLLRIGEWM